MKKADILRIPDYLSHLLEALNRIFTYIEDIDEVGFLKNTLVQDAVIRNLEILGGTAQNLTRYHPNFIAQYPEVPWESIQGLGSGLSHDDSGIHVEIVWKTLEQDLPDLQKQVQRIHGQSKNPSL